MLRLCSSVSPVGKKGNLVRWQHRTSPTLIIDELKVAQKNFLQTREKGGLALRG